MNALKRYSRTLFCSVGFLAAALVAGCGGGGDQGRGPILGLPAADIVSVAVTPATASVAKGATQAFVATASYADGSSRDVTVGAAWTSATPAVATVNATSGVATGVTTGTSVITAAFSGKSGSSTLTVTPATLVSVALSPLNPSINIGAAQKFAVTGTFSDSTTADVTANSTFKSGTPAVATIDAATGLALGVSAGPSLITATSGGISNSTT
ncbi:MAG TPA: Ig-like domain-containing protein, partial [Telluria sp.]|nr:Ig-like domain-containing protein [Telluria sp.]